jgi:IS30 family transposase
MSRRLLAEISGNRAAYYELLTYQRGKIKRSHELGQSIRAIAKDIKFAPSTVQNTLKRNPQRNEAITLPRTGRPRKYTERDKRRIIYFIQINLKSTYRDIC